MQQIIKQTGLSRQLFETVNFAFMKLFDFLVKIVIFWAFLLFRGWLASRVTAEIELGGYIIELDFGHNAWRESSTKKQKRQKNGYFD